MAELKIYLPDSLNERFRRIAMSVYGYGRGSLSKAAEEALNKWCSEREHSTVSEKAVARTESVNGTVSHEVESHVDPDEREKLDQKASLGRDQSSTPVGSTAS